MKEPRLRNQDLLDYIQSVFQEDYNRVVCTKQAADYRKLDHLKNEQIAAAVKYWFEIKGNSTDRATTKGGIGIVPYIINEAEAYWKEQERLAAIARENQNQEKQEPQDVESVNVKITPIKKPIGIYYFDID